MELWYNYIEIYIYTYIVLGRKIIQIYKQTYIFTRIFERLTTQWVAPLLIKGGSPTGAETNSNIDYLKG